MKRQRGRGRKPNNPGNRSYESNGPDVKIRGNANQIYDKYLQYARDAQTSGDRINAEAYFQHAEHYYRIMAANMPKEKLPGYQDDQDGRDDEARADDQSDNDTDNDTSSENEGGRKPRQSRSQSQTTLMVSISLMAKGSLRTIFPPKAMRNRLKVHLRAVAAHAALATAMRMVRMAQLRRKHLKPMPETMLAFVP